VAVARIIFGLIIAWGAIRFLARGWVDTLYLDPANHLTYASFEWVRPLPAPWMHLVVIAIAGLGLCMAAGYRHRLSSSAFLIAFTYTELIEASLYLNHYWFLTLMAVTQLLLPVQHRWSLDARAGRVRASSTVPVMAVWVLRAQLAVVYLFAGLAKLNPDWLLHAQPLELWFADRADEPLIGSVLSQPTSAYVASWAAALFDLTIVGWLLWRRTTRWAYLALVVFHLATGWLFQIGLFHWVMILMTLVFFEPDWPRRWLGRFPGSRQSTRPFRRATPAAAPLAIRRPMLLALGFFAVVQVVLPLRHFAYPSNVRWSEEGYYLSWRVMLTDKAGLVTYRVTDPSSERSWEAGPELVLEDWQQSHAATRPDLIVASAKLIAEHYADAGLTDVEVRADAWVSFNGGRAERLVDPTIDLASVDRGLSAKSWILDEPQR